MWELTNQLPEKETDAREYRTYMNGTHPKTLPKYLEEFALPSTTIEDGPPILQCKGPCANADHIFLGA